MSLLREAEIMAFEDELETLKGIVAGDPRYVAGQNPSNLLSRAAGSVTVLLKGSGLKEVEAASHRKGGMFDLIMLAGDRKVGVELRFGSVTPSDLQRYSLYAESSDTPLDQVFVICAELNSPTGEGTWSAETPVPVQVMTFTELIETLETGPQGMVEILSFLSTPQAVRQAPRRDDLLDDVRDYITDTFGESFFTTVSKDEVSLPLFNS